MDFSYALRATISMTRGIFIAAIFSICLLIPHVCFAACSWNAATGTAASLSVAEVTACLNDAKSKSGAIEIKLPAGRATWNANISMNFATSFANVTSLTLIGSGTPPAAPSRGAATTNTSNIVNGGFSITGAQAKKVRISNINFSGVAQNTGMITINGTSRPALNGGWRIDHCTFNITDSTNRTVWVEGYTYGVIDSSIMKSNAPVIVGIREQVSGDGGNNSWARGAAFGTSDAVYVENNEIEYLNSGDTVHMCIDSDAGGRFVFRYNNAKNCYVGSHDCSSIGNTRSALSWEVYENTFSATKTYASANVHLRGGSGYVYNNDFIASNQNPYYQAAMVITNYRSFDYASATPWTTACSASTSLKICRNSGTSPSSCTSDANCGGTSGSCVYADDPAGDGKDYPCRDQIGRVDSTMKLLPALWWGNTLKLASANPVPVFPSVDDKAPVQQHIVLNRDYCQHASVKPASCNGVTTNYTAYQYPHPLTLTSGSSPIVVPANPANLSVTLN